MKHMKDYYRFFYEDKVPLSQASLKKYDRYPVPKRRQCEMYLNSIKYSQPQNNAADSSANVNVNANPSEFQESIRNFPLGFHDFAKEEQEQQQQSHHLVVPSFANRFEIPSNVSVYEIAQHSYSFEDERDLLNSYLDKRNNNVHDNDEVDITMKCGDQPMDLTVPYPAYTNNQAGIFDKLPPDMEAPRSEAGGEHGEEVLDLSMKTSTKPVLGANPSEFYNVHDLTHRAFLERNLPQRMAADPKNCSEFSENKKWNWLAPHVSSPSCTSSYSNDERESGQSLLARRSSVSLFTSITIDGWMKSVVAKYGNRNRTAFNQCLATRALLLYVNSAV